MATTDFKYCTPKEVLEVCPELGDFNAKRQVRGWKEQNLDMGNFAGPEDAKVNSMFYVNDLPMATDEILFIDNEPVPDITFGRGGGVYSYSHDVTKVATTLDGMFGNTDTAFTINALTADAQGVGFAAGFVKIEREWHYVNNHTGTSMTNIVRGIFGTNNEIHHDNDVYAVASNVSIADMEYYFWKDSDTNLVVLNHRKEATNPQTFFPEDKIIEVGYNLNTYLNKMITDCSMELSSMLDARFPRPIQKNFQYNNDLANETPEYDYVIKRITALMVAHHMIASKDPNDERALGYLDEANNYIEKLNSGHIKLSFEVDKKDLSGDIVEMTRTGSMYLMETYTYDGWLGQKFDRVRLECTTLGAYGTAKFKFLTYGQNKLMGNETSDIIVTGGLQHIGSGLYVRFEGNSMAVGDKWDIVLRNVSMKDTNASVRTIKATRNPIVPKRSIFE
tara:strand:- start:35916 stop:37259 length:1344 start_codon:yes stop_codon:yes gene_type:complete